MQRLKSVLMASLAGSLCATAMLGPAALAQAVPAVEGAATPAAAARTHVVPLSFPGFAHDRHRDFKPDPAIRFGTLPNGLRYAVQPWPTPKGEVSLRMRFAVGSLMERDDQAGLAHFLEHMAFNGSENVPESEFDRILSREGLAFGPDSNAYTSWEETVYQLDMPNAQRLELGLSMMRETAGRLLLDPAAIDRERGVIAGEERVRDNPGYRQFKAWATQVTAGTAIPRRVPIGSMRVVAEAPRERFVELYRGYYRPEHSFLVVVGDVDPVKVEAEVARLFSDWQVATPAGPAPDRGVPDARPGDVKVLVEPQGGALVRLTHARAAANAPDTNAKRRADLLEDLAASMLNERLERIARRAGAPIVTASTGSGEWFKTAHLATIEAQPTDMTKWREALGVIDLELRRALAHGFTADEFAVALASRRAAYERAAQQAGARRSTEIAQSLINAFNADEVATDAASELAWFNAVAPGLTVEAAGAALRETWGPKWETEAPMVFISATAPIEGGEAAVRAAHEAARAAPATAPQAQAVKAWDYVSFGAPGRVVSTRAITDLGVTQVRFANGVALNVKPSTFEAGRVRTQVRFGNGQMGLPASKPGLGFAISSAFAAGGLKRFDADELTKALAGRTIGYGVGVGDDAFTFNAATTPQDLELQMQVDAAFLTDPAWRPDGLARLKASKDVIYRSVVSSPGAVWGTQGEAILRSGDRRFAFPTPAEFDALTLSAARQALDPALKSAPLEITIVGDTSVEAATRAVAKTFGALPRRAASAGTTPAMRAVRFPAGRGTETLTHAGRADQAMAMVFWPMRDYGDGSEARALRVLQSIFQVRLTEVLREKLGDTYSPGTDWSPSTAFPGYGTIGGIAEVKPAEVDRVIGEMERIAADLARGNIGQDLFDRARAPLIADIEETRNNNPWWVNWLSGSASDPRRLTIIRDGRAQYERVTLSQARALARQYFDPTKARLVRVMPGPQASPVE
jgi:zinc protease